MFGKKKVEPNQLTAPVRQPVPIPLPASASLASRVCRVSESPSTAAARAKLEQARAELHAGKEEAESDAGQFAAAEQRLAQAGAAWQALQGAAAGHARGEGCPKPEAEQLSDAIAEHAVAELEVNTARQALEDSRQRQTADTERLQRQIAELEHAIRQGEFQDAVIAYREAIQLAVPLARAVRVAAAKLHKNCSSQPLLLDPDAEYGRQLFGAAFP